MAGPQLVRLSALLWLVLGSLSGTAAVWTESPQLVATRVRPQLGPKVEPVVAKESTGPARPSSALTAGLPGLVARELLDRTPPHNLPTLGEGNFTIDVADDRPSGGTERRSLQGYSCSGETPSYICQVPSTGKEYCCPYPNNCQEDPQFENSEACFQAIMSQIPGEPNEEGIPEGIAEALEWHNVYRCQHGAPPLEWDNDVAAYAQTHAETCIFQHTSILGFDNGGSGENLALGYLTLQEAITAWYEEVDFYDFDNPGPDGKLPGYANEQIGHFTALVWKSTTKVGCGIHFCESTTGVAQFTNSPYIVCQYSPPGNVNTPVHYETNVLPQSNSFADCASGLIAPSPPPPPMQCEDAEVTGFINSHTLEPVDCDFLKGDCDSVNVQTVCCKTCSSCEDATGVITAINFCTGNECGHPTCSDFVDGFLCFSPGFEELASDFCPASCGLCAEDPSPTPTSPPMESNCPDDLDTSECPDGCSHICGTAGPDTLYGTPGCNCIWGFGKPDVIYGDPNSSNYIFGGPGKDTLYGGSVDDLLVGGAGADSIWGFDGNDSILGGPGVDYLYGGPGDDTIGGGKRVDYIFGGTGNDNLTGGKGPDVLYSGPGINTVEGGSGPDTMIGAVGAFNTFLGQIGADVVYACGSAEFTTDQPASGVINVDEESEACG